MTSFHFLPSSQPVYKLPHAPSESVLQLHKNPDPDHIPCFRVVNAKGELAGAFAFGGADVQAELLREDGVEVVEGKVDLTKYQMDDQMEE